MKPLILHISGDYPDQITPDKTRAIAALVEGSSAHFEHRVYSLNRVHNPRAWLRPGMVRSAADDGALASWEYAAPPGGIWLRQAMERVADQIILDVRQRGLRPGAVHGHKLSIEGLAAKRVAEALGIPFLLTLQGNTDQKIITARRDLRASYRSVWQSAAQVVAFAPWIAKWCETELGQRGGPLEFLPCMPVSDVMMPPSQTGPRIVTAFNFNDWRNKNIRTLAQACQLIRPAFPGAVLEIAGSGSAAAQRSVNQALSSAGIAGWTSCIGQLPGNAIQAWMNQAAVFVLPSRRESFGMVFIEALLAGTPIIYPRGAAVDGYFDDAPFAIAVEAGNARSVADALETMLAQNHERKVALAQWQASSAAQQFTGESILSNYTAITKAALHV